MNQLCILTQSEKARLIETNQNMNQLCIFTQLENAQFRERIQNMNHLCILTQSENTQFREMMQNMHFNQQVWLQNIIQNQIPRKNIIISPSPYVSASFAHISVISPPVMPSATTLKETKEEKKWKNDWIEFELPTEAISSSPFSARQYLQRDVSLSSQQPDEQDKELKKIQDSLLRSLSL